MKTVADELIKVAESSTRGGFFLMSRTAMATVMRAHLAIIPSTLKGK